jgi:glyoxylase-like metal-dependent hydrolase (beta-lactamase superfamily II)
MTAAPLPCGAFALGLLLAAGAAPGAQGPGPPPPSAWSADLATIQRLARTIPGDRPARINLAKFAESRRTKNFSVQGAPAEPSIQARTAFQVVYPDGTIMIDAGMDEPVHRFFGRGVEEPYDAEAAAQVRQALQQARLILVTHEHGDHVAGVVNTPARESLAARTILTRAQIRTLTTTPQMPEIRLTPEQAARYIVVDYDRYLPVAPGIVLVEAAGHTPGSQMVYVVLANDREYLLIGDIVWHMDGVRLQRGKDAPWIVEDTGAIARQLAWLDGLMRAANGPVLVASHDEEQHRDLVGRGLLGARLE